MSFFNYKGYNTLYIISYITYCILLFDSLPYFKYENVEVIVVSLFIETFIMVVGVCLLVVLLM